jgi:hypothetical protein
MCKLKLLLFGLLFSLNLFAQNQFESEKIFVQTDAESYFPGDTIWLKTTVFNATTHHYSALSGLAYIMLIDKNNNAIKQIKIPLINGQGGSQIVIPSKTIDGAYALTAYTQLMRNEGEKFFFKKELKISKNLTGLVKPLPTNKGGEEFKFFPEGGNLVEGIESKVAFKIYTEEILKNAFEVKIQDEKGKLVSNFYPDYQGIGTFEIKPQPNAKYFAVFNYKKKPYKIELPAALPLGYVVSTDNVVYNEGLIVNIHSNKNEPEKLRLKVHQRGEVLFQNDFFSTNTVYKFVLNNETFTSEGIVHLSLTDTNNVILSERLAYVNKNKGANVSISKIPAGTQSKVSFTLTDQDEKPLANQNLTLSVSSVTSTRNLESDNAELQDYLIYNSDVFESIKFTDSLDKLESTVLKYSLDNLMLTLNWKRDLTKQPNTFIAEKTQLMQGTVRINEQVAANQTIRLYIKSKEGYYYQELETNTNGAFGLRGFWEDSVKIYATNNLGIEVKIDFEKNYIPKIFEIEENKASQKEPVNDNQITNAKIITSSKTSTVVKKQTSSAIKDLSIGGQKALDQKNDIRRKLYKNDADQVLNVTSDMATTNNFELLKQNFSDVIFDKYIKKFNGEKLPADTLKTNNNPSLIAFIDGARVPVEFLSLVNIADLIQIDMIKNPIKTKTFLIDSCIVINFLTKKGKDFTTTFNQKNLNGWEGYTSAKKFNFGKFDLKQKIVLPRKSTTTYWNPDLKTDANGVFTIKLTDPDLTKKQLITIVATDEKGRATTVRAILK